MPVAITVFVAVFLIVLAMGAAVAQRRALSSRLASLAEPAGAEPDSRRSFAMAAASLERVLIRPLNQVVPRSAKEVSVIRQRLVRAGYRKPGHVNMFYAWKAAVPILLVAGVLLTGVYRSSPFFILTMAGCLGFLAPDFVLGHIIAQRQLNLRLGLPDAIDLVVICIEAGLGLDQAVHRVSRELKISHPVISEEFGLVNLEQRAGRPRAEAWRALAERTGVDSVRGAVASIIQADQFGSSVAKALRTHSETLRTQRRQQAEEQAAKTTVKLVFPLVFCIFPSLFVVALGPSMIVMMEGFQKFFGD